MAQTPFHTGWDITKATVRSLVHNDISRMAGATAFFATFALPPILIIVVRTLGLFLDRHAVGRSMMGALRSLFGQECTASIIQTIRSFRSLEHNYLIATGIFLFLLFVATSLFAVIQNSINQLWHIRSSTGAPILEILKARASAFTIIVAGGVIFLSIQLLIAGQILLGKQLNTSGSATGGFIFRTITQLITVCAATVWLYLLFILLPDGRAARKIVLRGAAVTAVLLTIGKAVLKLLLRPVQVNRFYGISGAIALILLFMFYSSIFLYCGAALIRVLSEASGHPIAPKAHAERYRLSTEAKKESTE